MSINDLKDRLHDVPGIENLTLQVLMGRQVFGWNGLIAGVDLNATDEEIENAIRFHGTLAPGAPRSLPSSSKTAPSVINATARQDLAYAAMFTTPLPIVN